MMERIDVSVGVRIDYLSVASLDIWPGDLCWAFDLLLQDGEHVGKTKTYSLEAKQMSLLDDGKRVEVHFTNECFFIDASFDRQPDGTLAYKALTLNVIQCENDIGNRSKVIGGFNIPINRHAAKALSTGCDIKVHVLSQAQCFESFLPHVVGGELHLVVDCRLAEYESQEDEPEPMGSGQDTSTSSLPTTGQRGSTPSTPPSTIGPSSGSISNLLSSLGRIPLPLPFTNRAHLQDRPRATSDPAPIQSPLSNSFPTVSSPLAPSSTYAPPIVRRGSHSSNTTKYPSPSFLSIGERSISSGVQRTSQIPSGPRPMIRRVSGTFNKQNAGAFRAAALVRSLSSASADTLPPRIPLEANTSFRGERSLREALSILAGEKARLEDRVEDLKGILDAREQTILELQTKITESQKKIDNLEKENQWLLREIPRKDAEVSMLRYALTSLGNNVTIRRFVPGCSNEMEQEIVTTGAMNDLGPIESRDSGSMWIEVRCCAEKGTAREFGRDRGLDGMDNVDSGFIESAPVQDTNKPGTRTRENHNFKRLMKDEIAYIEAPPFIGELLSAMEILESKLEKKRMENRDMTNVIADLQAKHDQLKLELEKTKEEVTRERVAEKRRLDMKDKECDEI